MYDGDTSMDWRSWLFVIIIAAVFGTVITLAIMSENDYKTRVKENLISSQYLSDGRKMQKIRMDGHQWIILTHNDAPPVHDPDCKCRNKNEIVFHTN